MKRTIAAISAVFGLLLTLAGCNSDPEPIEPKNSAASIPVPSPPAPALEDTAAGRAAFASHFVDLVNYTAMAGDTEPLLAVTQDCSGCVKFAETTALVRIDGHRPTQAIWQVSDIEPLATASRIVVTIAAQPELGIEGFELGVVTTTEPPYRVRDLGRLQ